MFEAVLLAIFALLLSTGIGMVRYKPTQPENLLQHSLRLQIAELVEKRPGITKGDLQRALACPPTTIDYHLQLLDGARVIRTLRSGRSIRYFPTNMPSSQAQVMAALRQGRIMEFAQAVVKNPGMIQKEISTHLGMSRKVIASCVGKMADLGLIQQIHADGHCTYQSTAELNDVMAKLQMTNQEDEPGQRKQLILAGKA